MAMIKTSFDVRSGCPASRYIIEVHITHAHNFIQVTSLYSSTSALTSIAPKQQPSLALGRLFIQRVEWRGL